MTKKKAAKKKAATKKAKSKPAVRKQVKKQPQVKLHDYLNEVRIRAYELFNKRGSAHGSDLEDWLTAEKEIKHKYGIE
jgi:hypothetical protein